MRDQVASDMRAAWGDAVTVILGRVPVEPEALPYAAVVLDGVDMEFESVRRVSQTWRVTVYGVFQRPAAGVLPMDYLAEKFDELSVLVEANELYATVGMMPHMTRFEPEPAFDVREGVVALSAQFSFATHKGWGE